MKAGVFCFLILLGLCIGERNAKKGAFLWYISSRMSLSCGVVHFAHKMLWNIPSFQQSF